jgi:hypothetical protein
LIIKLAELSIATISCCCITWICPQSHDPMLQLIRTQCITWKFSKLTSIEVHCSAFAQKLWL